MEGKGRYGLKFTNRRDAGQILAKRIDKLEWHGAVVLALPRGGVPVAAPLAKRLGVPVQVLLVRKLGAPRQPEFALGAVAENGVLFINEPALHYEGLTLSALDPIISRERIRIEDQKKKFRNGQDLLSLTGKKVVIVDDGVATGATVFAAIEFAKRQNALKIAVGVPVCAPETARHIRGLGVDLISLIEPERLASVGMWYQDFSQVEDEEVIQELNGNPVAHSKNPSRLAHQIAERLLPLSKDEDLAPLIAHLRNRSIVMLGESTHGTAEFYKIRAKISQFLIRNEGFSFVAVEGDWPDSQKINLALKNGRMKSVRDALRSFKRWPTWMWANEEVAEYLESEKRGSPCPFFGLDVYSFFESMDAVIEYAKKANPFLAKVLKERYSCFEPFQRDEFSYARSLERFPEGCAAEVILNLEALLKENLNPAIDPDDRFSAEQNARIVVNAESYYRALLSSDENSWNVRDGHMLDTLDLLLGQCLRKGKPEKGIVWAHNTHIGDYRATDMVRAGYKNLGGLARQSFGADRVALVGFGTYSGRVVASNAWGGKEQIITIPEAPHGTWDAYFHEALKIRGWKQGLVIFETRDEEGPFSEVLGQRAMGVVYQPNRDSRGNTVPTSLARRYDAFIFVDETTAVHSLHAIHETGKFPETWPHGM
jgi:erythromycin esterase-like protein/adenine/guanine phosphoribosyltransferase-like PRPP-binding protein